MHHIASNMLLEGNVLNGTYRVDGHLASGGFGNTYLVTNLKTDKKCVVKEFFMKDIMTRKEDGCTVVLKNKEDMALASSQKQKFKKEARRLKLLDSKHIVKVYDLFEENETAYYSMDFIEGYSLKELVDKRTHPLAESQMEIVLSQVIDALDAIHASNILHMDIKPANIMMASNGNCVLIDFGASKQIVSSSDESTSSKLMTFTNRYAPPEQINGIADQWGPWTDFYALGASIYYCITKKTPPSSKEIFELGDEAFSIPPGISRHMVMLIKWLMSPQVSMRPQSIEALRNYISRERNNNSQNFLENKKRQGIESDFSAHKESNKKTKNKAYIAIIIATLCFIILSVLLLAPPKDEATHKKKTSKGSVINHSERKNKKQIGANKDIVDKHQSPKDEVIQQPAQPHRDYHRQKTYEDEEELYYQDQYFNTYGDFAQNDQETEIKQHMHALAERKYDERYSDNASITDDKKASTLSGEKRQESVNPTVPNSNTPGAIQPKKKTEKENKITPQNNHDETVQQDGVPGYSEGESSSATSFPQNQTESKKEAMQKKLEQASENETFF